MREARQSLSRRSFAWRGRCRKFHGEVSDVPLNAFFSTFEVSSVHFFPSSRSPAIRCFGSCLAVGGDAHRIALRECLRAICLLKLMDKKGNIGGYCIHASNAGRIDPDVETTTSRLPKGNDVPPHCPYCETHPVSG